MLGNTAVTITSDFLEGDVFPN